MAKQTNKEVGTILVTGHGTLVRTGALINETPTYIDVSFSNNELSSARTTRRIMRSQLISYSSPNTRGIISLSYNSAGEVLKQFTKVEYVVEGDKITIFHSANKKGGGTFERTVTLMQGANVIVQPATVRTNEKTASGTGAKKKTTKTTSGGKVVQMPKKPVASAA